MTSRAFFVGGNWKMNGDRGTIDSIVKNLNSAEIPSGTGKSRLKSKAMTEWVVSKVH